MLEEAANEFHGRTASWCEAVLVDAWKRPGRFQTLDPAVGYGDLEHVGGEVADCVAVFPDRLAVDVWLVPMPWKEMVVYRPAFFISS